MRGRTTVWLPLVDGGRWVKWRGSNPRANQQVSRMERGITMPTVQRLAELAEIYRCGIDELLIASSNRISDQAELISQVLQTLPEADRAMVVEIVQKIAGRLKERL